MNTKQLLDALKPYTPEFRWCLGVNQWRVCLIDWDAATFYADDIDAALQQAFEAVVPAEVTG